MTTPLVGRAAETDAVSVLVRRHRVATIVGPGGVGKTSLAVEVGREVAPQFEHGVFLADLAPVVDAGGVGSAIASAVGAETEIGTGASPNVTERLVDFLRDRRALLIVDNCEHVVAAAAALVDDLVARCRDLRVLTTSREPLMINGEVLWPLAPLDVDDALTLFVQRARAVAPAFAAEGEAATDIRALCDRLDCLPLAIELAAARMRAFTPNDLMGRLDDRFRLLTAGARTAFPRQQTLRAVIDWSYDLLFEHERRVFERVSLFAGSFGMSAAEQVCADSTIAADDVAELLVRLVDKSLVTTMPGAHGVEFRMLQTLAQYGREQLELSGDRDDARARHARYVAARVEVPDSAHGATGSTWYAGVADLVDDIHLAMEWAVAAGDADVACAIASGLGWYWNMGGRIDDMWRRLTDALALGEPADAARRVRALGWAGLVGIAHDHERAIGYGREGVARARELGDPAALGLAAMLHGSALFDFFRHTDVTLALFAEAQRAFEAVDDPWSRVMAAHMRGVVPLVHADFDTALPLLQEVAARFGEIGNGWGRGVALRHVADIATTRGRYDDAGFALREAIAGLRAGGATGVSSGLTARLAHVYALQGRDDDADRWFDEALVSAEKQRYVPALALTYNLRGIMLRRRDRFDEAERCHRDALALYADRAAPAGLSLSLASLGYLAARRGHADPAHEHQRASLRAARAAGDYRAVALALEGLAGVAMLRGDAGAVGRCLGAAAMLREGTGGPLPPAERDDVEWARNGVDDRRLVETTYAVGHADPGAVVDAALG